MSAYRFCRTDDIALLVDALNRCWLPYFPAEGPVTVAAFKRSIRDLQVWCSSCMVAFAGDDPIGVLIGAKRQSATLIHRIAIHPDHRRQGHARHMLESLGSKLAILGPPRIVAEVPEALADACALFDGCGYVQEARLTDYVLLEGTIETAGRGFVIPITVDDLVANGLLDGAHPPVSWDRAVETLMARREEIAGFACASDERIEACLLHRGDDIVSLRSWVEDDGARLRVLLARLGTRRFRIPRVHPEELSGGDLERLGFRPSATHRLYAAKAQSV